MNVVPAEHLNAYEIAQLMHFYAESGVEWLVEDEPVDRFAEFASLVAQRAAVVPAPATQAADRPSPRPPTSAPVRQQPVAVPDAEAAAEARRVAASANTLVELADLVAGFTGCNLRNGARNTAFLSGSITARIAVAGGVPGADDDRDGSPFSGMAGGMLARMLAAISIPMDDVLVFNLVPWRPPGNRPPTPHEAEICRPFGARLLEILQPRALLALGNYPARYLSGSSESIHGLRGKRIDIAAGDKILPMIATFHPLEILQAPLNKRLVWQDLLAFKEQLTI